MQSEYTAPMQDIVTTDSTVSSREYTRSEGAKDLRRKAASPSSLVPALTLVALQFVRADLAPLNEILLSMGNGGHRP